MAVIPLLAPIFRGELAPMGEKLQCALAPPAGAVQVAELLQPQALAGVMRRHARWRRSDGADLRPIASAWALDYLAALLPPVVAAGSLLQHVFPVAAAQMWVRLDAHGNALDFHLRALGEARQGADTAERYAPLLHAHLAPLFAALGELTRVAPKILWGSVARHLEPIFSQALALTGGAAHVAQDAAWLLERAEWAPGEPNPMHATPRVVPVLREGRMQPLRLHRQCCLYHLLPGEGYCGACPLAPCHAKQRGRDEAEVPAA